MRFDGASDTTPLRADRWWSDLGAELGEDLNQGRCLGIRCNILARALLLREITHHLRGSGKHDLGWGALRWQKIVCTNGSATRCGLASTARFTSSRRKLQISFTSFTQMTFLASDCLCFLRIVAVLTYTPCLRPSTSGACCNASR